MQTINNVYINNILDDNHKKSLFNDLYKEINGYEISFEAKKNNNESTKALTYGEVSLDNFSAILFISSTAIFL